MNMMKKKTQTTKNVDYFSVQKIHYEASNKL